jgi:hypothetical protein
MRLGRDLRRPDKGQRQAGEGGLSWRRRGRGLGSRAAAGELGAEKGMKRYGCICLLILAWGSPLRADFISLSGLSNPGNTGLVQWNDGAGHSGSVNAHISQFHMSYVDRSKPRQALLTYGVDLLHREQPGVPYTVNAVRLLSAVFGVPNGGEMSYLYRTYGTANLSGNPDEDAGLQLALWDLSLSVHHPTSFTQQGHSGVYSSGDGYFSVSHLSGNPTQIAYWTNFFLQDASHHAADNSVYLLQSVPPGNHHQQQQSVLYYSPSGLSGGPAVVPVPGSLVLTATGLAVLGCRRLMQRRRAPWA